jgi:hypothetical protein
MATTTTHYFCGLWAFSALLFCEPFVNPVDVDGIIFIAGVGDRIHPFGVINRDNIRLVVNPAQDRTAGSTSAHVAVVN